MKSKTREEERKRDENRILRNVTRLSCTYRLKLLDNDEHVALQEGEVLLVIL